MVCFFAFEIHAQRTLEAFEENRVGRKTRNGKRTRNEPTGDRAHRHDEVIE